MGQSVYSKKLVIYLKTIKHLKTVKYSKTVKHLETLKSPNMLSILKPSSRLWPIYATKLLNAYVTNAKLLYNKHYCQ